MLSEEERLCVCLPWSIQETIKSSEMLLHDPRPIQKGYQVFSKDQYTRGKIPDIKLKILDL